MGSLVGAMEGFADTFGKDTLEASTCDQSDEDEEQDIPFLRSDNHTRTPVESIDKTDEMSTTGKNLDNEEDTSNYRTMLHHRVVFWTLFLTCTAALITVGALGLNIVQIHFAAHNVADLNKDVLTPVGKSLHWILNTYKKEWVLPQKWVHVTAYVGEILSVLYIWIPYLPVMVFAAALGSLISLYNKHLLRVTCVDAKKLVAYHYAMRNLIWKFNDCFGASLMVLIIGDCFQMAMGTLDSLEGCWPRTLRVVCIRYQVRHIAIALRMVFILFLVAYVTDKRNELRYSVEHHLSKVSCPRADRLMFLAVLQGDLSSSGVTGSGFFVISRKFLFGILAFALVLWALHLRLPSKATAANSGGGQQNQKPGGFPTDFPGGSYGGRGGMGMGRG